MCSYDTMGEIDRRDEVVANFIPCNVFCFWLSGGFNLQLLGNFIMIY